MQPTIPNGLIPFLLTTLDKHTLNMKQLLTLFFLGTLLLCANAQSKQPLRFVHAIPDAGPVDVRVGGKTIFNNVKFGTVTTSVFLTTNEALDVSVVTAVTKSALLEDTFTFEGPLTIAAIGKLAN